MPKIARVATYADAYKRFVEDNQQFGLSPSASAAEGTRRRHGAALVRSGVLFKGVSNQWLVDDDRYPPAMLYVLTRGRAGAMPPKVSRAKADRDVTHKATAEPAPA